MVGRSTPRARTLYWLSRSLSFSRMLSLVTVPSSSSLILSAASAMKASLQREGSAMMFHTVVLRASTLPVEV